MKFVFHEVGGCEWTIRTVLSDYLRIKEKDATFYSISHQKKWILPEKAKETEYLLFYKIYVPNEPEKIRIFLKENSIRANIVALCRDDLDGIEALEKGSDYALLLPLNPEMIIRCYEHFESDK